jgi:hypothetical protein
MIDIKSRSGETLHRVDGDSFESADLARANLRVADLLEKNLARANLAGADLTVALLMRANLQGVNLEGATLSGANLGHARLVDASLTRANLYHAHLASADLGGASLVDANLLFANLDGARLEGTDLHGAIYNRGTQWPGGFDPDGAGAQWQAREIFPEYRVRLERVLPGESAVPGEYPDNLGQRTKLGGEPDWIQIDDTPGCPQCEKPMSFVAQIDSIDYTGWGVSGPYMFSDVGMIYLFFCGECGEASTVLQFY